MSLASYHCSTPGSTLTLASTGRRWRGASCRGCCRLGTAAAMTLEHTRGGELAQLVADHIFSDEQLQEGLAVMNHERVADEIGHDRAIARPRFDRLAMPRLLLFHFLQQTQIDVRTFLQRSTHVPKPSNK